MNNRGTQFIVLFLAFFAALSLGAAACPKDQPRIDKPGSPTGPANGSTTSGGPAIQPAPPRRVYDERNGVALLVPQDWTVEKMQGNPILFAMAPAASSFGPSANVVIESLNQRMAPYDYLEANQPGMGMSMPGLTFKKGGVEAVGSTSTAWIQFTFPRGQILEEAVTYCQTKNYKAYVVTCVAPANLFSQYEPLFRNIGRSLQID